MSSTLFLLAGPSGVGKNSIISEVIKRRDSIRFAPSLTTRSMRGGESEGSPYYFVTRDEFSERIANNDILENVEVHGHQYGTSKAVVLGLMDEGFDVITDIEVIGAQRLSLELPGKVCPVFVTIDSEEELVKRIRERHPVSPEELARRLQRARFEKQVVSGFRFVIDNIDLANSVDQLESIIEAEHSRMAVVTEMQRDGISPCFRTVQFELDSDVAAQVAEGDTAPIRTYLGAWETEATAFHRVLVSMALSSGRALSTHPLFTFQYHSVLHSAYGGSGLVEVCAVYKVTVGKSSSLTDDLPEREAT